MGKKGPQTFEQADGEHVVNVLGPLGICTCRSTSLFHFVEHPDNRGGVGRRLSPLLFATDNCEYYLII